MAGHFAFERHAADKLYRNNGNGTFTEKAVVAGVAFSEDGVARAGMGVDTADYDAAETPADDYEFFEPDEFRSITTKGGGLFVDEAPRRRWGALPC